MFHAFALDRARLLQRRRLADRYLTHDAAPSGRSQRRHVRSVSGYRQSDLGDIHLGRAKSVEKSHCIRSLHHDFTEREFVQKGGACSASLNLATDLHTPGWHIKAQRQMSGLTAEMNGALPSATDSNRAPAAISPE